jgi:hypothetical protein
MTAIRPVSLLAAAILAVCTLYLPRGAFAQPRDAAPAASIPATPATRPDPARPFADWAALVVAGDWRAHDGGKTQAFENGRRDVVSALKAIGFEPGNIAQYSLRPPWPGDPKGLVVDAPQAIQGLLDKAAQARGGCLVYLTSHGSPDGAVFGPDKLITPRYLGRAVDLACPNRPAVVVVSACFSGVFTPRLKGADRLVLTAARKDRASFGCGSSDVHTYYDACVLRSLPAARDFPSLGPMVQACVAQKEQETGARPASQPQVSLGKTFAAGPGGQPFPRPPA